MGGNTTSRPATGTAAAAAGLPSGRKRQLVVGDKGRAVGRERPRRGVSVGDRGLGDSVGGEKLDGGMDRWMLGVEAVLLSLLLVRSSRVGGQRHSR